MCNIELPQFPNSYWRASVELPTFSQLKESSKCDVGIVGGGITGITTAYLLAKQNISVTLIDADHILTGTTGHTTAKITAQHGLIYDEFSKYLGTEKTGLYYKANIEAANLIEKIIKDEGIECDFSKQDSILFTNDEKYVEKLALEKKMYDSLNIAGALVSDIPLEIPIKSALIMKDQAQFHPVKYLKGLVESCIKLGVQFYEQTTAVDVEYNKYPAIITEDGHRITCRYVIQASHYPFYDGQGFYPTRMYADRAYVVAAKSSKKFPGGMYISAEEPTRSIRTTTMNGEDLLLFAGENHKTGQGESTIKHYEALQTYAERFFSIESFKYRWSAQDLVTLDKLPYVGPVTKNQKSVLVATGYRKWGMTNGTMAAKLITDLITEADNPYTDLFSPSRFQADPALKKFASINADVAKHLIKGKLEYTGNKVNKLKPDEATIARINGKRTGIYRDTDNQLHMVDTTCTHLGCEVAWNSGDRTWDCPCHGSRFSYMGDVVEGPAKKPLKKVKR